MYNDLWAGLINSVFDVSEYSRERGVDPSERPYHPDHYIQHTNFISDLDRPREKAYQLQKPYEPQEQGWRLNSDWAKNLMHDPLFQRDYLLREKVNFDEVPVHYQLNYEGMEKKPPAQFIYDQVENLYKDTWDENVTYEDERFKHIENEEKIYYKI